MTSKIISGHVIMSLAAATMSSTFGSSNFNHKIGGILQEQMDFQEFVEKFGKSYPNSKLLWMGDNMRTENSPNQDECVGSMTHVVFQMVSNKSNNNF